MQRSEYDLDLVKDIRVGLTSAAGRSVVFSIDDTLFSETDEKGEKYTLPCPDHELALILMELKIQGLQKEGFVCEPPPYTPDTPVADRLPLAAKHRFDPEQVDYRQFDFLEEGQKLFMTLEDLDLVTLCDTIRPAAEESNIPELSGVFSDYPSLNCIHLGLLRKFFYRPESQNLSGLWLTCGFDTLFHALHILAGANALSTPISLTLNAASKAFVMDDTHQIDALIGRANLQELRCSIDDIQAFFAAFHLLESLEIFHSLLISATHQPAEHEADYLSKLEILHAHEFQQLNHISIHKIDSESLLLRLLDLPLIPQLSSLTFKGMGLSFPFDVLRKNSEKWRHLDQLTLCGYSAPDAIVDSFLEWPQVTFDPQLS